jgi:predicted dithiol-disulfide oxidoreductase (DUF899 family)
LDYPEFDHVCLHTSFKAIFQENWDSLSGFGGRDCLFRGISMNTYYKTMETITPPTNGKAPAANPIVSPEEWLAARQELLTREKELTRLSDRLAADRRALPWTSVDKVYTFDGAYGPETLSDLFDGRSQLVVQHFMFAPGWKEGCVGCSLGADHVDGARQHFEHNNLSFAAVSRAPIADLQAYRKRMGWDFKWVSSHRNSFNFDYHVSFRPEDAVNGKVYYNYTKIDYAGEELPGVSVFYKDEHGTIYHTYSAYARGTEFMSSVFSFLDITAKGRNENGPNFSLTDWVRHHDKYDAEAGSCCH